MGIDKESDIEASLQTGPTSFGMVRIYVRTEDAEIPMDFDPEDAEEIARELLNAAQRARQVGEQEQQGQKDRQKKS